ncbi:WD domain, G-beta repeat-containing protein [Cardiosporidium cionae]|uniref:methylated diphthine methylhydrolase n=1 Tax=Cardiosporidium cionae TaxID=476202 RepID=A0ABQ7JD27_9APIC|nr:WD domain, G-beta repeat-containing protein [Cardiosporidium cionae]|eukprot:KAF8821889.1 WD domain, G-beta repeat-containing protein [Cardiosporidium cionae]
MERRLCTQHAALYTTEQCGILDLRWILQEDASNEKAIVVGICSDYSLRFFQVRAHAKEESIEMEKRVQGNIFQPAQPLSVDLLQTFHVSPSYPTNTTAAVSPSPIGLALDAYRAGSRWISFSCSDGRVYIVKDRETVSHCWKAHELETWTVAFDPHQPATLLATGADDCSLRLWDTRTDLTTPMAINSKCHTMGVTALTYSPYLPHQLYSGSYDELLRIWDTRQLRSPVHTFSTLSGIWRIKCRDSFLFIASCHGGAEIWKATEGESSLKYTCLTTHKQHASMVYGITSVAHTALPVQRTTLSNIQNCIQRGRGREVISPPFLWEGEKDAFSSYIISTCSFYDKRLNIWTDGIARA